jgi:tRNA(Ile)-lysidine synthase
LEHPLITRLKAFAVAQNLFHKNTLILIALSGGKDSVVLTHLLKALNQPMELMHCNFQLRGQESERDELFVKQWADELQVPLHNRRFDTNSYAEINRCSIQVAARELRYAFFEQVRQGVAQQGKMVRIATAHHAADNAETVLMHLFRGTGIEGLKGIPAHNGAIIRPLLWATPAEIESYATQNNLNWVEDSSNLKATYIRNFIRHKVMPLVEESFPQALSGINATAKKATEAAMLYREMVEIKLKKGVKVDRGIDKIAIAQWQKMEPRQTLIWEWIKKFGFTEGQTGEVEKLMVAQNGKSIHSASHRLLNNRGWLLMIPNTTSEATLQYTESLPADFVLTEARNLTISKELAFTAELMLVKSCPQEALVDAALLHFPLILRPTKPGDYFYPLGMQKKKKVARLLIDLKLSMAEKEQVYVLESDHRILWVAGYRLDDRFKITDNTKNIVKLWLQLPGDK